MMINVDSSAVSNAFNRLDSIMRSAVPKLQEGGEAFVDYTITLFLMKAIIVIVIFTIGLFVCVYFLRKSAKIENNPPHGTWPDRKTSGIVISGILGGISALVLIFYCIFSIPYLIVALKHPVVYTIMDIAGKTGGCGCGGGCRDR